MMPDWCCLPSYLSLPLSPAGLPPRPRAEKHALQLCKSLLSSPLFFQKEVIRHPAGAAIVPLRLERLCAPSKMGDVDLRRVKCGWLSPAQARSINGDAGELARFVRGLPKAELHVHVEGTFEPETMLAIALRNGLEGELPGYDGDAEAWCESQRSLRNFDDLQGFLDLYYAGCDVLRSEDDFYDLCMSYCRKAAAGGVRRAEIFFDPQTHTVERNALPLSVVINGLHRACVDAKTGLGLDAALIMCFLRHRHPGCTWASPPAPAEEPLSVLEEAIANHRHQIIGVGLDSSEAGNPPSIFRDVFQRARAAGLRCVAHAGEEGPAAYIAEALDLLGCERIDHGVRCLEEPKVVRRLAQERVPLTVCPCR